MDYTQILNDIYNMLVQINNYVSILTSEIDFLHIMGICIIGNLIINFMRFLRGH